VKILWKVKKLVLYSKQILLTPPPHLFWYEYDIKLESKLLR